MNIAKRDTAAGAADMSNWADEETDDPLYADKRNFYKVEKWTRDDQRIERMLWAGNFIDKARQIFNAEVKRWPRIRLTIRQGIRILQQWPQAALATARVALEEKSLPLHDPEDALVVGRWLALCGQQSIHQGGDAPIAVGGSFIDHPPDAARVALQPDPLIGS